MQTKNKQNNNGHLFHSLKDLKIENTFWDLATYLNSTFNKVGGESLKCLMAGVNVFDYYFLVTISYYYFKRILIIFAS